MAPLKYLSDNSNIFVFLVLACIFFSIQFRIFMVLGMIRPGPLGIMLQDTDFI